MLVNPRISLPSFTCWCGAGSQFFITYAPHPHLDGTYTIFGHVIDGLEALERMEKVPVDESDRPVTDVVLKNVTIHANPIAERQL